MTETAPSAAKRVRANFCLFSNFEGLEAVLTERVKVLHAEKQQVALAFLESLRGVVQTLSIPFNYTYSQVHSLHWQRILIRERIRSDSDDVSVAGQAAKAAFDDYIAKESGGIIADHVIDLLAGLLDKPGSLAAARELVRQGVVLIWSAFEVLARDMFVDLLNNDPRLVERLQAHVPSRKRFTVEKIDWQTLSGFNFDLSASLGTLLSQRADLDDIQTIRDAYDALFPLATTLRERMGDDRLWIVFQKRNLIVHRRGIIDRQYIEKTGATLPIGSPLWVSPSEIDEYLEAVVFAGTELLTEAAMSTNPSIQPTTPDGAAAHDEN